MEYIDKGTHHEQGNQFIDDLLEEKWIDDQSQYVDANYAGLRGSQFYSDLSLVLLSNQNKYCCYCMQKIDTVDTSLEHIIPQKTESQEDFDAYLCCEELRSNVIFSKCFDRRTKLIPPGKYPHDIAYYNIVASCKSNAHCNHKRGNKRIKPLMYDFNLCNEISYDGTGLAHSEKYNNELSILGISTDKDLIGFRRVWKILADTVDVVQSVTDDEIDKVVYSLSDVRLLNNLTGENNKKRLFRRYSWFFDYYKARQR